MKRTKKRNILVDMSATLIHHGHIRLLKKASKYGKVILALTTDKEIKKYKKITPELNYNQRKEIFLSIKYIHKVIPSKYVIENKILKQNNIDLVLNGHDYKDRKLDVKSIAFKRTKNISSTLIRMKAKKKN